MPNGGRRNRNQPPLAPLLPGDLCELLKPCWLHDPPGVVAYRAPPRLRPGTILVILEIESTNAWKAEARVVTSPDGIMGWIVTDYPNELFRRISQ